MSTRTMSVAGSFYPAKPNEVNDMIQHFNAVFDSYTDVFAPFAAIHGKAVIVPHAGWIYSGFTANIAFRILSMNNPKTIIVIGPSHRIGFEGISSCDLTQYQTPLGDLKIDTQLLKQLQQEFTLPYYPQAHQEHSTEVQMPFIKHYFPKAQVIELVYGYADPEMLEPIIEYCLSQTDTAIVISTDLSHYYSLDQAKQLDSICLEAIRDQNTLALHQGCEACGIIGVEAMLNVAKKTKLHGTILDYRTSADASGDPSKVVGYASVVFS